MQIFIYYLTSFWGVSVSVHSLRLDCTLLSQKVQSDQVPSCMTSSYILFLLGSYVSKREKGGLHTPLWRFKVRDTQVLLG